MYGPIRKLRAIDAITEELLVNHESYDLETIQDVYRRIFGTSIEEDFDEGGEA